MFSTVIEGLAHFLLAISMVGAGFLMDAVPPQTVGVIAGIIIVCTSFTALSQLRAIPLEADSYRSIGLATRYNLSPAGKKFAEATKFVVDNEF